METIRVIKKDNKNRIVADRVRLIHDIRLNPIDKPVFVEIRESVPRKIVLEYPSSKEKSSRVKSANGRFVIEYGTISGRIKEVIPCQNHISGTDLYELSKAIKAAGSGIRFKSNVESQMKMVGKLLPEIKI